MHDKKGVENVVANHLSRLEGTIEVDEPKVIDEFFPDEQLHSTEVALLWYENLVIFLVCQVFPLKLKSQQKKMLPS